MVLDPRNLEWLNHNATRAYPLAREATRLDETGTFQIPNDFLVALYLSVPAHLATSPAGFHVLSVVAQTTGYKIVIGYRGTAIATAVVASASHTRNNAYRLAGTDNYTDVNGSICVGDLTTIEQQPPGSFQFTEAAGRLEVDTIRPSLRGLGFLQLQNGQDVGERITGDVRLVAGRNVRLEYDYSGGAAVVVIHAVDGAGLNEACVCGADTSAPIQTINGIPPTPSGDFVLSGNDCIELEPIANGLRIADRCSQPCCGCNELEVLTSAAETLRTQIATLEMFVSSLESKQSALDSAMFSSIFGEGACDTC